MSENGHRWRRPYPPIAMSATARLRRARLFVELPQDAIHVRGIPRERGHAAFTGQDVPADVPARFFERHGGGPIRPDGTIGGHLVTVH